VQTPQPSGSTPPHPAQEQGTDLEPQLCPPAQGASPSPSPSESHYQGFIPVDRAQPPRPPSAPAGGATLGMNSHFVGSLGDPCR
jgi:hypothetical protein